MKTWIVCCAMATCCFIVPASHGAEKKEKGKEVQVKKMGWEEAEKYAQAYIKKHKLGLGKRLHGKIIGNVAWFYYNTPEEEEENFGTRILIIKSDGSVVKLRDLEGKNVFSPKKAKEIAFKHTKKWGKPTGVMREDLDTYRVYFKTPKEEELILSKRMLFVKRDGNVELPMRK